MKLLVQKIQTAIQGDIVKHELRVMSCELWVASWEFKSASSNPKVASSNPRVTKSNPRVQESFIQWKLHRVFFKVRYHTKIQSIPKILFD